eukprot:CAMPEP_0172616500 /NCGR_PEP_ID=MMETSP1068-20121228/64940_1 /TAXON_ID=35684 /ORGANISM="Pseudopedinella elastica, Strain CCMP716" /LENGTH=93 /DNA_ID=CAMNT_0013421953 /DNA_START=285 /DNA_END=562 /DNA_ORIENTATION=+
MISQLSMISQSSFTSVIHEALELRQEVTCAFVIDPFLFAAPGIGLSPGRLGRGGSPAPLGLAAAGRLLGAPKVGPTPAEAIARVAAAPAAAPA